MIIGLTLAFGSLGCDETPSETPTIEIEKITTQPDSNVVDIPLLERDNFIVWSYGASDDGGKTYRAFQNGFSLTQIAEREAGAAYAVKLVSNAATTPLAIWDYKGNQFFPVGPPGEPIVSWIHRKDATSTPIFAVTDKTHEVWRLDADWTSMPLPVTTEQAALITEVAGRIIVWARSGEFYALEPNTTDFVALGANVLAVNGLYPLRDGRLAIVSVGQPDKLRILELDNTLSAPRDLPLSGGASKLEVCRDNLLAAGGKHSKDLGMTWVSPLDAAFPLAWASDTFTQATRCHEDRILQIVTPNGRNPAFVEINADGSFSTPKDAKPALASGQPNEIRVLSTGQLATHYPLPQFYDGTKWQFQDFPQLPLISRSGQWHAYAFTGIEHFTSTDGLSWQKDVPTHDGQTGTLTGSRPAVYFAGKGNEIWALTGNEMLSGAGTLSIKYHWSQSSEGRAFTQVAESTYTQDFGVGAEVGSRLDVVGVSAQNEVATRRQFAADGKSFVNVSFEGNAAGVFDDGRVLTQKVTYTKDGNRFDFIVRDQAGVELSAWTPTLNGVQFRDEIPVLGIDAQNRIWMRCAIGSSDICRTSPPQ